MFAYIGGYTTPDRDGRGNGINVFDVRPDGEWVHVQLVGGLENPSLFTLNAAGTRLYSVHGGRTMVSAFAIDPATGQLTLINQVDPGGGNPVDSALDPTERFLIVANYSSGTVAVLPVGEDGSLGAPSQLSALPGQPGPHPKEQTSSHPHGVIMDPSGRFVIVPDKGLDRTFLFRFADGTLTPTAQGWVSARPGAAPRHAAFHPTLPVLYVNNELDSTVSVYDWAPDTGHAAEKQVIGTLSAGFTGRNTTAEIVPSPEGRVLYVSNRGQDSVAYLDIDPATGLLRHGGFIPTGGARPRFFTLGPDGKRAYVANQDSDSVTVFDISDTTGRFTDTGRRIMVGSPSAISFVGGAAG
ncbi:lactonase family protein [Rhodopila sp.]|jgi:6-phosphogluconolactonase (cycloisomerase 2 family)|uniref:lactonase family protein n=1 Tax=Rhodopila sp. TaxID=2480087 RepID=UPI002BE6FCF0|nr:lactonase family protein [Rhodopila sp.]HVZ09199.1 lactonase family protein [Rhodopila sp.]